MGRSMEILSEIHEIKKCKLTIPHQTRNSPSSFVPLGPNDLELRVLKWSTRIRTLGFPCNSHRTPVAPTPYHQPTSKTNLPEPNTHTSRMLPGNPDGTRPPLAPPSRDLRNPHRLTRPRRPQLARSLARLVSRAGTQRKKKEEVRPRTWAATRSSSAAAAAAAEWPRPRSRSTRCSCRCSAKPRSFRSDDFISAPPHTPRAGSSPGSPARRRGYRSAVAETLSASCPPRTLSHCVRRSERARERSASGEMENSFFLLFGARGRVLRWCAFFTSFAHCVLTCLFN
jgi:hypothetical protein